MKWLALDIGGANLKIADGGDFAASQPFPLWQKSSHLHKALERLLKTAPASDAVAVTMTGELADCYRTKAEGVRHILSEVQRAATDSRICVYRNDGQFVSTATAIDDPLPVAAANWHALARFVGRFIETGLALLIDIGSTTTDIIPLNDGNPVPAGFTDTERLIAGELVYAGITRTPIATLAANVPYRGQQCGLARECFARTADVYLTLGELPENEADLDTPDGRPATKTAARRRLARMICADEENFDHQDAFQMANAISQQQSHLLTAAIEKVAGRQSAQIETAIISGSGEFLARKAVLEVHPAIRLLALSELSGTETSHCGAAHALAVLAREECL